LKPSRDTVASTRKLKKGGCFAPGGVFFQDIGIASLKT
jgi:hypothetical protein